MSDYDNTNTGALFKNDKEGNDKRPDYRGPINVDGKDLEVAAWLRESKSGQKYMSLRVSEKRDPDQTQRRQESTSGDDPNDPPF